MLGYQFHCFCWFPRNSIWWEKNFILNWNNQKFTRIRLILFKYWLSFCQHKIVIYCFHNLIFLCSPPENIDEPPLPASTLAFSQFFNSSFPVFALGYFDTCGAHHTYIILRGGRIVTHSNIIPLFLSREVKVLLLRSSFYPNQFDAGARL